ncbi:hypothetical protein [Dyadobacter psychrophilus]|nr:hypothetical protein [Dyadobacter psychrophilus]
MSRLQKHIPLFASLTLVVFRSDRAQKNDSGQLVGERPFWRNNQVSSAHRAANSQDSPFNNDFVQIDQRHSITKGGFG